MHLEKHSATSLRSSTIRSETAATWRQHVRALSIFAMKEQVMSNGLNSLSRLPEVDTKNLRERKLLEAELLTLDKQIRNFGQLRDRFSAVGGDANAYYRKVQARRLQILKELKGNEPHSRPVGTPCRAYRFLGASHLG
jgi:hypothetical protein